LDSNEAKATLVMKTILVILTVILAIAFCGMLMLFAAGGVTVKIYNEPMPTATATPTATPQPAFDAVGVIDAMTRQEQGKRDVPPNITYLTTLAMLTLTCTGAPACVLMVIASGELLTLPS